MIRLVLGPALVAATGVAPALAVVGRRAVAVPLTVLLAALQAALAAIVAVALELPLVVCFAVVVVAAQVAAGLVLRFRPAAPPAAGAPRRWPMVLAAVAALGVGLLALEVPAIDHDGRSIWLVHARLLHDDGSTYQDAIDTPALRFSHLDYPPLLPASAAVVWEAAGSTDYRIAQGTFAVVGGAALVLVAWAAVAVAASSGPERWAWRVGPVVGAGVVLAALHASPRALTNAYADGTAAAAGVAAALAALVLGRSRVHLVVAGVCLAVASLTKLEGTVLATLVAGLAALRPLPPGRPWWARAALPACLVPAAVWYVVVLGTGASLFTTASSGAGSGQTADERFEATVESFWTNIWPWPLSAALVLALAVVLGRARGGGARLAVPLLVWLAMAGLLLVLGYTYVTEGLEIHDWLAVSAGRVTSPLRYLAMAEIAVVATVALAPRAAVVGSGRGDEAAVEAEGDPPGEVDPGGLLEGGRVEDADR